MKLRSRVLISLVLFAACRDSANRGARAADDAGPILPATATGSKEDCPVTGLWALCTVIKRLEQAGLAVHTDSLTDLQEPPLAIAGKRLPIARGEIEIFLYADTVSRARDQAKLDRRAFIPPSRDPSILHERTLIANENLLVLMNVANETNRERIANNLMAGPPQPPRSRP